VCYFCEAGRRPRRFCSLPPRFFSSVASASVRSATHWAFRPSPEVRVSCHACFSSVISVPDQSDVVTVIVLRANSSS
jgi:hypothetical protein